MSRPELLDWWRDTRGAILAATTTLDVAHPAPPRFSGYVIKRAIDIGLMKRQTFTSTGTFTVPAAWRPSRYAVRTGEGRLIGYVEADERGFPKLSQIFVGATPTSGGGSGRV